MFGRKKMYKKGLADALQANEAFSRKQEAAIAHMREEVRAGTKRLEDALNEAVTDLGDNIVGLYNYLNTKEKAALYHLNTPLDIKDLGEDEKRLLLSTLYQLAYDEGDSITDAQRGYIRSVQKYMEITNPQTEVDLSAIGNVDSLEVQKTFLQVILEFFYLQDGDELNDDQESFLGWFSVNRNQASLIEDRVSRLFNAVGPEGVAEKYGYVPEENLTECIDIPTTAETASDSSTEQERLFEALDKIFSMKRLGRSSDICYETQHYIVYQPSSFSSDTLFRLDKETGEVEELYYPYYLPSSNPCHPTHVNWNNDSLLYFERQEFWIIDIATLEPPRVVLSCKNIRWEFNTYSITDRWIAYTYASDNRLYLYDLDEETYVPLELNHVPLYAINCTISDGKIYFLGWKHTGNSFYENKVCSYDIETGKLKIITNFSKFSDGTLTGHMSVYQNNLIMYYKGTYHENCTHILAADLTTLKPTFKHIGKIANACYLDVYYPDGRLYVDQSQNNNIYFLDYLTLETVHMIPKAFDLSDDIFIRVGDYIYYYDNSRLCRVAMNSPLNPEIIDLD